MKDFPLPGWEAQRLMSPIQHSLHPKTPEDATLAAVFLLLKPIPDTDQFTLLFIKRASKYANDKHKGQVSFAGGKKEPEDNSMLACGLREVEEELGFSRDKVRVLGALSTFYIFISGFLAYPFVGLIPHDTVLVPEPNEVDYIIEVEMDTLFDPASKKVRVHHFGKTIIKNSPYYDLGEDMLWGATAMMTSEFEAILKQMD